MLAAVVVPILQAVELAVLVELAAVELVSELAAMQQMEQQIQAVAVALQD
jgi:hypothetical protein